MTEQGTSLEKAIDLLKRDELVAIPTETVYGLAGNAFSTDAVAKIFAAKNRPSFDPLIVHVGNMEQVESLVQSIPTKARELASQLWPGPLTLLLKKELSIPDLVTSGMNRVAVRLPSQPITKELLQSIDFPLVAPSANPFGYVSPTTAGHVADQLTGRVKYILDGGPCPIGIESTIVGFEGDKTIIYRPGGVSTEDIEKIIGKVDQVNSSTSNPAAPGMLKSHYAPFTPLKLGRMDRLLKAHKKERIGLITFADSIESFELTDQITLAPDGEMNTAAKGLFAALRNMDERSDIDLILAEPVPNYGLGIAINDRLRRAASK